jgi:hypothetical protein
VSTPTPIVHRRRVALLVLAWIAAVGLAACAGGGSASEQIPTGPKPSITVVVRVGSDVGSTVELLGTGTSQAALNQAAGGVAQAEFPDAQAGQAQPVTADPGLTVATVPIQLPSEPTGFELDSGAISSGLENVHPKAIGVWVCTDDRRSLLVDSSAPGATTSDAVNGQCQVAGSTLAGDGVSWTARVSVGAVQAPSKLPWLIGAAIVVALIAGGAWLMRSRRAQEPDDVLPPPMPPAPPVH